MIQIINNMFWFPNIHRAFTIYVDDKPITKTMQPFGAHVLVHICDNSNSTYYFQRCEQFVALNSILYLRYHGVRRANHYFRYTYEPVTIDLSYHDGFFRLRPDNPQATALRCITPDEEIRFPYNAHEKHFGCANYMLENDQLGLFTEHFLSDERFDPDAADTQSILKESCESADVSQIISCEVTMRDGAVIWGVRITGL